MESFVPVPPDPDFPLENLPWGVFELPASAAAEGRPTVHVGVALGEHVVSATALEAAGLLRDLPGAGAGVFAHGRLNELLAAGRPAWRAARAALQRLLSSTEGALRDDPQLRSRVIHPQADVTMRLPCDVGDYTDFYTSREHATNVGAMFRGPANALSANWLHQPIGYHGRASSIVPSAQPVRRPRGQVLRADGGGLPAFGPSAAVDFELEMAAVVGPGNALGDPIPVDAAAEHVFGLVLLNDWSARDIQKWEYVPLGPFNGKNWATQVSPWVVTLDALEPYRCAPPPRQDDDPPLLPYLWEAVPATYDVSLSVEVAPPGAPAGTVVTRSNLRHLYWTFPQMIAHHTAGGCNLRPGDLVGSGTISGPEPTSRGCLLELTWGGRDPVELRAGGGMGEGEAAVVQRRYLEDGDTVVLRGWCGGGGEAPLRRIGFGECRGTLLPPA